MLLAAYDDAAGVTAKFNMNVLVRINRELEANFNPQLFRHQARWNEEHSRIEMHLESTEAQDVVIEGAGLDLHFMPCETIHTENSYKFTDEDIRGLLSEAGFQNRGTWKDRRDWYSLTLACLR